MLLLKAESEHFDSFLSSPGDLKYSKYDLLLRQRKSLSLLILDCTAYVQLWLPLKKELQSHISLDRGAGSLRVKARSKSQQAAHCFEKRTAEKAK